MTPPLAPCAESYRTLPPPNCELGHHHWIERNLPPSRGFAGDHALFCTCCGVEIRIAEVRQCKR